MKWDIKSDKSIPFFSTGSLQLYHIVEQLLRQTGKADLFISSFTISEEFIRKLYRMKQNNLIGNLQMLIDLRNSKKMIELTHFLSNVADDVFLANNHSKLVLIKNNEYRITLVTSQNQTRGNRCECGMVSTEHSIYNYFTDQINDLKNKSLKYNGIFGQPISTN